MKIKISPEQEKRADKAISLWECIPEPNFKELWKNDTLEFKRNCAILMSNQVNYMRQLSEQQTNNLLKAYNFTSHADCLSSVYKFCKFYKTEHIIMVAVENPVTTKIKYVSDSGTCSLDIHTQSLSKTWLDNLPSHIKEGVLAVLVPFTTIEGTKPALVADLPYSVLSKINI